MCIWFHNAALNPGGKVGTLAFRQKKIRQILAMLGWLTPIYLVCVSCQST